MLGFYGSCLKSAGAIEPWFSDALPHIQIICLSRHCTATALHTGRIGVGDVTDTDVTVHCHLRAIVQELEGFQVKILLGRVCHVGEIQCAVLWAPEAKNAPLHHYTQY